MDMEPQYSGGVWRSKLTYILQQENMKTWQFEKPSEIMEDLINASGMLVAPRISEYFVKSFKFYKYLIFFKF